MKAAPKIFNLPSRQSKSLPLGEKTAKITHLPKDIFY
jgi:hypothetical protein